MLDFRAVIFLLGGLLCLLAVLMLIPLGVEALIYNSPHWKSFASSSFVCGFTGALLATSNHPSEPIKLGVREAFLLTTLLWCISCVVCALPFYFGKTPLSFMNALFESTSSLTTTGATILTNLDNAPKSILLWRALLQWIGGVGIIVTAMIVFPILRIGGMQLFQSEFSDKSEKILPRMSQIASTIVGVYVVLSLMCAACLHMAGMNVFDSLCHAMSTLSTGGMSTRDGGIMEFDLPAIEYILSFFMILGGGTLILYARMWSKGWRVLWQDPQFRTYLLAIGLFSSITVLWGLCFSEYAWTQIFSRGIFSTISVITTTGFNVEDYNEWGHFISTLFLFLCVVGGCTGSTSGGIKIFRFQVMFRLIVSQLKQLRRQYGVYMPVYKGAKLEGNVISSVFVFVFLYIGVIFTIALSLSFFDLDLMTSFTSAIATIGNIGGGIGNVMEPAESYVALENGPKLILMLGMILGRLELLTVLVLFVPGFWRD